MIREPDESKRFVHPVLGEIIGYDNVDDFDAAVIAWNLSQGLDANGMPIEVPK